MLLYFHPLDDSPSYLLVPPTAKWVVLNNTNYVDYKKNYTFYPLYGKPLLTYQVSKESTARYRFWW